MAYTRDDIAAEVRSWIGTPYHYQAAIKGVGVDCIGLISGVWKAVTGLDHVPIPPFNPLWIYHTPGESMYLGFQIYLDEVVKTFDRDYQTTDFNTGDVILLRMVRRRPAKHGAFVLVNADGSVTMVHAAQQESAHQCHVAEEPMDDYWLQRVAYVFKFRGV